MIDLECEINRFMSEILPFGSIDIRAAVQTAIDGRHEGAWAADQIKDFVEETGTSLSCVDPNYVIYDALLQEARNDIQNLGGSDIMNDTSEQVYVVANFSCTTLDYSDHARTEIINILAQISSDNYTDAMRWLITELDIHVSELRGKQD